MSGKLHLDLPGEFRFEKFLSSRLKICFLQRQSSGTANQYFLALAQTRFIFLEFLLQISDGVSNSKSAWLGVFVKKNKDKKILFVKNPSVIEGKSAKWNILPWNKTHKPSETWKIFRKGNCEKYRKYYLLASLQTKKNIWKRITTG